jgi:nucleotide-binding universal stress UspA family protein
MERLLDGQKVRGLKSRLMRRVLVPLDGSDVAARIFPDARRLAGPDGELILVRNVRVTPDYSPEARHVLEAASRYLDAIAEELRADEVAVRTETLAMAAAAFAIDEAARIFEADMIAAATHGHGLAHQLVRDSVAWQALVHSPIPILLRHAKKVRDRLGGSEDEQRHILVPIDGSRLAEKALPLAEELAREWEAPILLVQVVPEIVGSFPGVPDVPYYYDNAEDVKAARAHLDRIGEGLPVQVDVSVVTGPTVDTLVDVVKERSVTDIVMASHGRTGLARVILGSVADGLIHALYCPIVVEPALAMQVADRGSAHGQ